MASYLIENGTLEVKGEKTVMNVTFKANDGREVKQYYEVDSTDSEIVSKVLADASLAFEALVPAEAPLPDVTVGTAVNVEVIPEA